MSTERKLFANAFRQASPQRRVLCNQKTMSMKIEKNEERTVFGKEDQIESNKEKEDTNSFSSISSLGQRQQFKRALTDLHTTVSGLQLSKMDHHNNLLDLEEDASSGHRHTSNTLPVERAKNNSAPSECSQDSEASSNEFVKFDEQELANLPEASDILAQFGNRVASDVLDSALNQSDYNRSMDERDLYVPEGAGKAEEHQLPQSHVDDLDEFDPLAAKYHHELETVPEQKHTHFDDEPVAQQHNLDFDEGQFISKPVEPKPDSDKKDEPEPPKPTEPEPPKEPQTPIDNSGEEVIERTHHAPLTQDEEPQQEEHHDYNEIAENIREAVKETHERVDHLLDEFESVPQQKEEAPIPEEQSPSVESGDTILELPSNLPASESLSSGMRDFSPELTTFDRGGPLTLPTGGAQQQPSAPPTHEDFEEYVHNERPPTPPKHLNEPGETNPEKIDLGPPPPHAHITHRISEHGLQSILKHSEDKAWIDFCSIPPSVQEILLWRDPKKSAIALAVSLGTLILVAKLTLLSLIAWGSLLVLGGTLGFRVFKLVEGQVKKTDGSNPFKPYLEQEINLPQEKVHAQADVLVHHGQALINQLRRLFFVESVFDSVKFGVLLWTLTKLGAWFSGITLVTIFVLGLFSLPKVYELYKEPIDEYIGLARQNVEKVNQLVQEKLPFLKQAEKVEKKE